MVDEEQRQLLVDESNANEDSGSNENLELAMQPRLAS